MCYSDFERDKLGRVRIPRPSGLTLLTCALLVLLPALAVLQYRWVGQVSLAERERMQRNLRNAALQFREAFDFEIGRAFLSLQVGADTARDGASEQYSSRYDSWVDTAEHPQIVSEIFLVDSGGTGLRLRRWNAPRHTFENAPWPASLEKARLEFAGELDHFDALRPFDPRPAFLQDETLLVAPIRNAALGPGPRPQTVPAESVFGFTILQLDIAYIQHHVLPVLAQRHFTHTDGDTYRVAVTATDKSRRIIYRSDPDATVDPAFADATESLFGPRAGPNFLMMRGDGRGRDDRRLRGGPPAPRPGAEAEMGRPPRDDFGRWRLLVQHQSGSLEAAVGQVRRRNLAISFGVLLLLTLSVALLTVSSRRAQRLAKQQMEFVAGVSHELRTPVAVIRSAAENLSHGVVGSGDRVKRYGEVIESEARRLGEMVERVLQYAGIESGLGLGARMPLAPAHIIESAIETATASAGLHAVNVHREISPDLPPVIGDAAALRSAIQNLVANALKYGTDGWVGVRAEQTRGRRRSDVRITVSDHGPGIPTSELPHIFEPFYRGADAISRQIHGNGLGLSLVYRIVAAHGGRVSVAAGSNGGSNFTITLPAATADARPRTLSSEASATARS